MEPNFLDKKYADLAGSKPVERATVKARHDSERVFAPHSREERIQAYLNRNPSHPQILPKEVSLISLLHRHDY